MENQFRKPSRLRGTPGHKYVNLYAAIILSGFVSIGAALIYFGPDVISDPNSNYNKLAKFLEDPENDRKIERRSKFMFQPVRDETTQKTLNQFKGGGGGGGGWGGGGGGGEGGGGGGGGLFFFFFFFGGGVKKKKKKKTRASKLKFMFFYLVGTYALKKL
uniref:Uncharacterized protein n=1 Tax=Cacopsylla melanoneura TaxID=428564 RepID=A0A8D9BGR9_9HEMI